MTQDPILRALLEHRDELDRRQCPFAYLSEVRASIHGELGRLRVEMDKPAAERSWLTVRERLVAIAALCYRGCRDLALETRADAIVKDIPF